MRREASSYVFIPSDLEPGKVVQSAVYGQTLVAVDGSYDDVNRLTSELAETDEFEDEAFHFCTSGTACFRSAKE